MGKKSIRNTSWLLKLYCFTDVYNLNWYTVTTNEQKQTTEPHNQTKPNRYTSIKYSFSFWQLFILDLIRNNGVSRVPWIIPYTVKKKFIINLNLLKLYNSSSCSVIQVYHIIHRFWYFPFIYSAFRGFKCFISIQPGSWLKWIISLFSN